MAAIPLVLAASAPAPESFRSLRRSMRTMISPPSSLERCIPLFIGNCLDPAARRHKVGSKDCAVGGTALPATCGCDNAFAVESGLKEEGLFSCCGCDLHGPPTYGAVGT